MLHDSNIQSLVQQLLTIGIAEEIEGSIRKNICLHPDNFHVLREYRRDSDVTYILFQFEKKDGIYQCVYYEAVLRKEIAVPEVVVNEVNLPELDEKMSAIRWIVEAPGTVSTQDHKDRWQREEKIEAIVTALQQLSSTADGAALADLLRFKHWCKTPLQHLIAHAARLRKRYEIWQRFYFYADEQPITIDEAFRFLCHRWREKQMRVRNRLRINVASKQKHEKPKARQAVKGKLVNIDNNIHHEQ